MSRSFRIGIAVAGILAFVGAGAWAGGQDEEGPPNIRTLVEGEAYISPESSPGVQDSLEIPIEVQAVGNQRVIVAYRITVLNEDGRVVWLEESIDESPEPGFFARLFQNLGFRRPNTTVEIPESTTWDGTYKVNGPDDHPDDGKPVPEGVYTYVLEATDSEGTSASTDPQVVVVDNTPPEASVSVQFDTFSPNGDDQRDTVRITQQTSEEDLWVGTVLNEDATEVFAVEWSGQAPSLIVWDGTDPDGQQLEDGVYRYTLSSTDRAGNSFALTDVSVEIDSMARPLSIVLDVEAISPNDDGVQDSAEVGFADAVTEGLTQSSLILRNEAGSIVRTWQPVDLTGTIELDGRDLEGDLLPEGEYQLSAVARYDNGTVVRPEPVVVTIDTTPPTAVLRIEYDVFSPDGDGLKDEVEIIQETEEGARWQGIVRSGAGDLEASLDWGTTVPETVVWDGSHITGERVEDGTYQYQLVGIDPAGNQGLSNEISTVVDTRETTASIDAAHEYFSPNGDNQRDVLQFETDLSLSTGIAEYELRIANDGGTPVRTYSGSGSLPTRLAWNGASDAGSQAPEGAYRAELFLRYRKGNEVTATTDRFFVDRTVPVVELDVGTTHFSPNGDGVQDSTVLSASVSPDTNLTSSVATLVGPRGTEVIRREGFTSGRIEWDGTSRGGDVVADGEYRLTLEVSHVNGTTVEGDALVYVDTTAPEVTVAVDRTSLILTDASDQQGVTVQQSSSTEERWTGEIYAVDTGRTVLTRTWEGQARTFEWPGRNEANEIVSDGRYRYRISSVDLAGNRTVAESSEIEITTESLIRLAFDGAGLSPNGDGAFETVDLVVDSEGTVELGAWTIEIRRDAEVVRELSGDEMATPLRVSWDGRTADGSPVPDGEYTARIRAEYQTGSMGAVTPESVLVDTEGPTADLEIAGVPFSPDEDGYNDTATFELEAEDASGISRWQIRVVDNGELWRRFTGSTVPASQTWNGTTTGTRVFESASELTVEYQVTDQLGNRSSGRQPLPIGVMVDMVDGRRHIRVPNVLFEGYTTNYTTWDDEVAEQNMETLSRVVTILETFPSYSMELDGHAVSLLYYNERLSEREHREVLLPLSENRSKVIREALIDRGIDEERIEVNWFGGSDPIVPFSDLEGRWVNRRVEFYIVR